MTRLTLTPAEEEENEWRRRHGILELSNCEFFMRRITRAIDGAVYDAQIVVNIAGLDLIREAFAREGQPPYYRRRVDDQDMAHVPAMYLGHLIRYKIVGFPKEEPYFEIEQRNG